MTARRRSRTSCSSRPRTRRRPRRPLAPAGAGLPLFLSCVAAGGCHVGEVRVRTPCSDAAHRPTPSGRRGLPRETVSWWYQRWAMGRSPRDTRDEARPPPRTRNTRNLPATSCLVPSRWKASVWTLVMARVTPDRETTSGWLWPAQGVSAPSAQDSCRTRRLPTSKTEASDERRRGAPRLQLAPSPAPKSLPFHQH